MLGGSTCSPVGRRGRMIVEGEAILKLSSIGVEMSLAPIYEDTELDAIRLREGGRRAPALLTVVVL